MVILSHYNESIILPIFSEFKRNLNETIILWQHNMI